MSDVVVDSCVVVKWLLPEPDSPKAHRLSKQTEETGGRLIVLDLALPEVANAIWKRRHRGLITSDDARDLVAALNRLPIHIEASAGLLTAALEIALKYGRSLYDSLFVALTGKLGLPGVTADEPLFNMTHADFPQIALLRSLP